MTQLPLGRVFPSFYRARETGKVHVRKNSRSLRPLSAGHSTFAAWFARMQNLFATSLMFPRLDPMEDFHFSSRSSDSRDCVSSRNLMQSRFHIFVSEFPWVGSPGFTWFWPKNRNKLSRNSLRLTNIGPNGFEPFIHTYLFLSPSFYLRVVKLCHLREGEIFRRFMSDFFCSFLGDFLPLFRFRKANPSSFTKDVDIQWGGL